MRYAILADIHANLEALTEVLAAARRDDVERYICLGDIVGYCADPRECLKIISNLADCTVVAGNHDYAAAGKTEVDSFNVYAKEAVLWTRQCLEQEDIVYLKKLPLVEVTDDFTIVHSSLDSPEEWHYVQTLADAYFTFFSLTTKICFIGHSHIPKIFAFCHGQYDEFLVEQFSLDEETKYIIDVGSVGQPRDGAWEASYAIYDSEVQVIQMKRISYDVEKTQQKIVEAGLPEFLARRLTPEG